MSMLTSGDQFNVGRLCACLYRWPKSGSQKDALTRAGCERILEDHQSGAKTVTFCSNADAGPLCKLKTYTSRLKINTIISEMNKKIISFFMVSS